VTTRGAQAKATQASGDRLLEAAIDVIRAKGYSAARVEDICAAAGLTKGAFFHHFASKEACAIAAAAHFAARADALFDAAPYGALADPAARALGYIDFRKAILTGKVSEFTCLVGTMVQEVYETCPAIREACDASISGHAAKVEADIDQAIKRHGIHAKTTARSLALHTQAVLQGAFILAKAKGDAAVAGESIGHLRRYIELLFQSAKRKAKERS